MFSTTVSSCMNKVSTALFSSANRRRATNAEVTFGKFKEFVCEFFRARVSHTNTPKSEPWPKEKSVTNLGRPINRRGVCRVCFKIFNPNESKRTCSECMYHVCKTCTSYSSLMVGSKHWKCSVCLAQNLGPRPSKSCLDIPEVFLKQHSETISESTTSLYVDSTKKDLVKLKGENRRGDHQHEGGYCKYPPNVNIPGTSSRTWVEVWKGSLNKIIRRASGRSKRRLSETFLVESTYNDVLPMFVLERSCSSTAVIIHSESPSYQEDDEDLRRRRFYLSSGFLHPLLNRRRTLVSEHLDLLQQQAHMDAEIRHSALSIAAVVSTGKSVPIAGDDTGVGTSSYDNGT